MIKSLATVFEELSEITNSNFNEIFSLINEAMNYINSEMQALNGNLGNELEKVMEANNNWWGVVALITRSWGVLPVMHRG
jgi:hypothetical protein